MSSQRWQSPTPSSRHPVAGNVRMLEPDVGASALGLEDGRPDGSGHVDWVNSKNAANLSRESKVGVDATLMLYSIVAIEMCRSCGAETMPNKRGHGLCQRCLSHSYYLEHKAELKARQRPGRRRIRRPICHRPSIPEIAFARTKACSNRREWLARKARLPKSTARFDPGRNAIRRNGASPTNAKHRRRACEA
jgi:hypothetical protein